MQQIKLEVSPETYIKVREKQSELIKKTRQHINLKDITNIALQTGINSVDIESDEKGWILTAGINNIKTNINKDKPSENLWKIEGAVPPTLKRVKEGDSYDDCENSIKEIKEEKN